ncbi:MAG: hypothetical protein HY017_11675 [Betaproteobacteria bacterium]|nr:hypothetical protein [Betaproteobacteria bacterium]
MIRKRRATARDLGLTRAEFAVLRRLDTPEKIQAFLFALRQNFEPYGDTCDTVRTVLRTRRAHCIEGAMLAAAALWVHGEPPLLFDLRAVKDSDHVVTLFRRRGHWGALAKTNGVGLRYRDPVYRTLRELALSYAHEYANSRGRKTLREYSIAFDLRRMDPKVWVGGEKGAWDVAVRLEEIRHYRLMTRAQEKALLRRDPFERAVTARVTQYREPRKAKRAPSTYT